MSAIPLENVHGKQLAARSLPNSFTSKDFLFDIQDVLANLRNSAETATYFKRIDEIQFLEHNGQPAYLIKSPTKQVLRSAINGEAFPELTDVTVQELAKRHYIYADNPDKKIHSTTYLNNAPQEASRAIGGVWQVNFDDTWNTSLYFSPESMQLVSIRSDIWRLFDFVWMLHIMDYEEREDFNNPLLIAFAATSVLFTITGMIMLIRSFRYKTRRT